ENWPEYQQEDKNPWNIKDDNEFTWSTNNKEIEEPTTSLSVNQENQSEISDMIVEQTNNNNYFELGLLIFVLVLIPFSSILSWICSILLLYRAKFLLRKLRLADGDYITLINPLLIQYSQ
ncbi:1051_t:CDS:1, partial [Dentiscutata erythropus]